MTENQNGMVTLTINGVGASVDPSWSLLEAVRFYGIEVPTLCYVDGLTPYGACRLCIVEIGSGDRTKLVASCTHPVRDGLVVRTHSRRVMKARKMIMELLLARCPSSKVLQDMAAKMGISSVRFEPKHDDCILCGLCVRMCEEQMGAKAIGFVGRGVDRKITTPFDMKSDQCKACGACMYICPTCQLRCLGPEAKDPLCGGCTNIDPVCIWEGSDDALCYMHPCVACVKEPEKV